MAGSPNKGWLFLTALVSITVLGPLSIHMYLPVMPYIQRALGTSTALTQFSLSLVLFVMAVGTLVYGTLSDRYGRKRVLLGGLLLFGIGSAICTSASSIEVLLGGRTLQAAGAGCGVVMARAIARDVYGPDKLAQVIAYITVAYVLGPMFAPPIGGGIADLWGWKSVFAFALVVCVLVVILTVLVLGETREAPAALHLRPGIGEGYARLLSNKVFVGYALNPGLTSGAFFALASSTSFLYSDVYNGSASEFGLYFMLLPLGFMAGNFVSGRLGNRATTETMVVLGNVLTLLTVVVLAAILLYDGSHPIWMFLGGGVIAGGQGLSMPYAQAAAINVDKDLTGTASGIVVFLHFAGPAISIQLAGMLYDRTFVPMLSIVFGASVLALISGLYANAHARRAAAA